MHVPAMDAVNDNNIDDYDDENRRTIFCANLSDRVTEEVLYELFIQGGPVQSVKIPRDKDGRQKTFAFITYAHVCSVPYALELFAGVKLYNRILTLKYKNSPRPATYPDQKLGRDETRQKNTIKPSETNILQTGSSKLHEQKVVDTCMLPRSNNNNNTENKKRNPFKTDLLVDKGNQRNEFEVLARLGESFMFNAKSDKKKSQNEKSTKDDAIAKNNSKSKRSQHRHNPFKTNFARNSDKNYNCEKSANRKR